MLSSPAIGNIIYHMTVAVERGKVESSLVALRHEDEVSGGKKYPS
jgi:hypothetical protein